MNQELKAKDERIAELNADKVQLENDACVARGEIDRLTAENERLRDGTDCETESGGIRCMEQEDKILALTAQIATMRRIDSSTRDQGARDYAKVKSLTAEKQAQAERIEKLETFLTNLKDCASAGDITLIEQVLEGEKP